MQRRMEKKKISKQIIAYKPGGKRSLGRPRGKGMKPQQATWPNA
jgi:hypothetical protein